MHPIYTALIVILYILEKYIFKAENIDSQENIVFEIN